MGGRGDAGDGSGGDRTLPFARSGGRGGRGIGGRGGAGDGGDGAHTLPSARSGGRVASGGGSRLRARWRVPHGRGVEEEVSIAGGGCSGGKLAEEEAATIRACSRRRKLAAAGLFAESGEVLMGRGETSQALFITGDDRAKATCNDGLKEKHN
uniref:DUF834 domain-containing protein n=1 Tax=Oryza punctata TaxID=4537 RepID=A0A0E0LUR3_ORYPU